MSMITNLYPTIGYPLKLCTCTIFRSIKAIRFKTPGELLPLQCQCPSTRKQQLQWSRDKSPSWSTPYLNSPAQSRWILSSRIWRFCISLLDKLDSVWEATKKAFFWWPRATKVYVLSTPPPSRPFQLSGSQKLFFKWPK